MHPAKSVIFFTTMSGAGYGLLFMLIACHQLGLVTPGPLTGFLGFGLAFAVITAGLVSSTFHLGHPERAWRALTQWRTSWLSREGVMAIAAYVPTGLYAIWWCFFPGQEWAGLGVIGLLGMAACALTVFCTAMIYASLKTIHAWHNNWVPAYYLLFALMTGNLTLSALLHLTGGANAALDIFSVILLAAGMALKLGYWRFLNTTSSSSTAESATGLSGLGKVTLLEAPHTEANYLLKEMGFRIARKHSEKLRRISIAVGFIAPAVLVLVSGYAIGILGQVAVVLAVASAAVGIFAERWLFFAEAKHTVTLYYGASKA